MKNKIIYSILFLKGTNGISKNELKSLLNMSNEKLSLEIKGLSEEIKKLQLPLEIKENGENIRLSIDKETTKKLSNKIEKTIDIKLNKPVIETLTIVAYKQPTTRFEIEKIRGVSADYGIAKLIEFNLITSKERSKLPGNPRLYITTDYFLQLFDLKSLKDLPKSSKEFDGEVKEKDLLKYD